MDKRLPFLLGANAKLTREADCIAVIRRIFEHAFSFALVVFPLS